MDITMDKHVTITMDCCIRSQEVALFGTLIVPWILFSELASSYVPFPCNSRLLKLFGQLN